MKTLIAFYSRTGNTKKIAETLAKSINADLDEIIDQKDRSGIKGWILGGRDAFKQSLTEITIFQNPDDYDLVIIGTPVWVGASTPAFRTYLAENKSKIKKFAVFTTSGGDGPQKTVALSEKILGKKSQAFAGWTTADLKNSVLTKQKLDNFVEAINK